MRRTLWWLIYNVFYYCEASRCIFPCGLSRKIKELPPRHHDSFPVRLECGDVYTLSERHMCYTHRRGSSYAVAVYQMPSAVYGFLRPSAIFYLATIAIYRMPHSPIYVLLSDLVTYHNTVFTSDTSLAVAFASPLSYFTGLNSTVPSSHSLVHCPQSSKFCVDPSLACNVSSSSCASTSLPLLPSYTLTSPVPRSNLSGSMAACRRQLAVEMASLYSISSLSSS